MPQTLVKILRSIDQSSKPRNEKKKLARDILDDWRVKNPLLNKAVNRDISLYKTTEKLMKYVHKWELFPKLLDTPYDEEIQQINLLLSAKVRYFNFSGTSPISRTLKWINDKLINATTVGVILGLYFALKNGGEGMFEYELTNQALHFTTGFFEGLSISYMLLMFKYIGGRTPKSDALYLDFKIQDIYNP